MPPPLDELTETRGAEELALAAGKPLERPLLPPELDAPARLNAKPERGADGGGTERAAAEKLRAGVAVGRTPGFAERIANTEDGAAVIVATRALVAAVAPELTNRREAAS